MGRDRFGSRRYRSDMEISAGAPATAAAVIRPLRTIIVMACGAIVLLGVVAVAFTPGARGLTVPTTIQLAVVIAATCGPTIFIGRSVQPLPADGNAVRGLAVLRSLTLLRVGTAGSCALLGLALSISADNTTPYLIAGPIALILQLGFANPHRATLRTLQKRLEANVADSGLGALTR
jgi:hypothetical protein